MIKTEQNELLRTAYQIACRKGEQTNWDVFKKNLEKELLKQNNIETAEDMQAVSKAMGIPEEQIILRATCTARTYRMPRDASQRKIYILNGGTTFKCSYCEQIFTLITEANNHICAEEKLK